MALTPKAIARLQAATEKASRDFRSDVVTVPTQAMMQCMETGGLAVFSQAILIAVKPANGVHLTLDDIKKHMIPEGNIHHAVTRVVCLENTLAGTILPLEDAKKISQFVGSYPVPEGTSPVVMHLDGARIFDAIAAEGVSLKEYAACFDSLSICLAKGLGAPMGSIIAGTKPFIERAKYFKKMFGGATRQPGMMAAAALAAMEVTLPKLRSIHSLAYDISTKLEGLGYKLALPAQTNMIVLDLAALEISGSAFVEYCAEYGLITFPSGRIVFHHQVTKETAATLVAMSKLIEDKKNGVEFSSKILQSGCT
ncbi:unnamed protein product [Clonostachys rosea]|uniref:Aromatic amino acid beta-eliminating lyase/threonine aldolase domain-containing protein n=1 Tax=Bionectria ochroleuca TaxID=29856 RepID=A0ABY6UN94_BIOOC|nr:unnamed protein product [Clonostachys rosea]